MDAADVLRSALALPLEARAALVESLISSLDQQVDPLAEETWHEEIVARLEQIDSGAIQLVPWENVRQHLRSRL